MPGSGSGHAEDLGDTVCFSEALEDDMWPRTDLLNLLGIPHPIIQAPMSGFSCPALVAEWSVFILACQHLICWNA
jgi:hypothetical protein